MRLFQQTRHAEDSVHRRANFVAHHRQKFGLRRARLRQRLIQPQQLVIGLAQPLIQSLFGELFLHFDELFERRQLRPQRHRVVALFHPPVGKLPPDKRRQRQLQARRQRREQFGALRGNMPPRKHN